jgi:hypothetical protein
MPKQRDGPAPRQTAPGQGQQDERAVLLPSPEFLRKSRDTSPPPHRQSDHRQREPRWRTFRVRLCLAPDGDATALYVFLKAIARRHGLTVADVHEIDSDS